MREPGGTETGERIRRILKDPAPRAGSTRRAAPFLRRAGRAGGEGRRPGPRGGDGRRLRPLQRLERRLPGGRPGAGDRAGRGDLRPGDRRCLARPDDPAAHRSRRWRRSGSAGARPIGSRSEGIELQRRVAEGYDEVARRHPERVRIVDADGDRKAVHAAVLAAVMAVRVPGRARGETRFQMMEAAASSPAVPEALAEATRHQPRARACAAGRARLAPATPTSSAGRAAPARPRQRGRSRPSCWPTDAAGSRRRPPPRPARPIAASRPRLAAPAGGPAPGRGRP